MKNGLISDSQITASSLASNQRIGYQGAKNARLDSVATDSMAGAWVALIGDASPWLQIKFTMLMSIAGIVLQGRKGNDQWVTKYEVQSSSNNGVTWEYVKDESNEVMVSRPILIVHSQQNCDTIDQ